MPLVLRVCVLRRTWQSHCTSVQVGWIRHYFLQDFSPSIGREETGCSRHISIRHTSEEKFDSREGLISCQLLYLTTHTYTHQFLFFSKLNLNSPLTLASFQIFLSDAIEQNTINLLLPPPPYQNAVLGDRNGQLKQIFIKTANLIAKNMASGIRTLTKNVSWKRSLDFVLVLFSTLVQKPLLKSMYQ